MRSHILSLFCPAGISPKDSQQGEGGGDGSSGGGQRRHLGSDIVDLHGGGAGDGRGGERGAQGAASSGGQAGGGPGTGAGGRGVRRRKHVGSRKREVQTTESASAHTPRTPDD